MHRQMAFTSEGKRLGCEPQLLPTSTHKVKKTFVLGTCHRENGSFTSLFIFNFLFPPKMPSAAAAAAGPRGVLPSDPRVPSLIPPHLVSSKHKGWRPLSWARCAFVQQGPQPPCARRTRRPSGRNAGWEQWARQTKALGPAPLLGRTEDSWPTSGLRRWDLFD